MIRPEQIPPDVWERLTVGVAVATGMLPEGWPRVDDFLVADAHDKSLTGTQLRECINTIKPAQIARARTLLGLPAPPMEDDPWGPVDHARGVSVVFGGERERLSLGSCISCGELIEGGCTCFPLSPPVEDDHARAVADVLRDTRAPNQQDVRPFSGAQIYHAKQRHSRAVKPDDGLVSRPARLPSDVWDKLTVREATLYGLLTVFATDVLLKYDAQLMRKLPRDLFIARDLHEKVQMLSDKALEESVRAIRAERKANGSPIKGSSVERSARCAVHNVYTMNGIAYCSACAATEEEIHEDHADARKSALEIIEHEVTTALDRGDYDLKSAYARAKTNANKGLPSAPASVPADIRLREDICPNNRPLLPPYVVNVPMGGRATVHMQSVLRSVHGQSLGCAVSDKRTVSFSMPLNNPSDIQESGTAGDIRRMFGHAALIFDLAVRSGIDAAVSAYGLILFALAVRRELQQREADRLFADTDAAMDAVMATARELAESEWRR